MGIPEGEKRKGNLLLIEEIISICNYLFQKIETERITSNSFSEVSITLFPKQNKDITRKLQTNIFHEHRCKNSQ